MKVYHYSPLLKPYAQELRKHGMPQEKALWCRFLRDYPIQFRRQKQFGRFIVDFYCSRAQLVIELDGEQHQLPQGLAYDTERTAYLQGLGLTVMRFQNAEIEAHFSDVCAKIDRFITSRIE